MDVGHYFVKYYVMSISSDYNFEEFVGKDNSIED